MKVQVKFLSTSEEVTFCETDLYLRSYSSVGTSYGIAFDIEVVWLVEYAVDTEVESVGIRSWCKLEVCAGEYTCGINLACRLQMVIITVFLAGS